MAGQEDCGIAAAENLSPLWGFLFFVAYSLGLTPQAMYLSRLWRSVQSSAPHLRYLGKQRGRL